MWHADLIVFNSNERHDELKLPHTLKQVADIKDLSRVQPPLNLRFSCEKISAEIVNLAENRSIVTG
jgi:hypothetical protein